MNFLSTPTFEKEVKKLAKKYPRIKDDLEVFKNDFIAGKIHSDRIPGLKREIYKARWRSTDMKRGKRGGYRIIYYLQPENNVVILLIIYAKVERKDISVKEIQDILKQLGL
jgi:mRNA-degrading endonuclease RelE of RelBE toxin-antitoxin system